MARRVTKLPDFPPAQRDVSRAEFSRRAVRLLGRGFTDQEGAERDRWWLGKTQLPDTSVDVFVAWARAMEIAGRIRAARGSLNQRTFATKIGMKPQQLNRYERGVTPGRDVLAKIARAAGVSVDWLLSGMRVSETDPRPATPDQAAREWIARQDVPRAPRYAGGTARDENESWTAALRPTLAGSPLEGAIAQMTLDPGDSTDKAWRALPDDRKREVIDVLRSMASVAVIIDKTLPKTIAEAINDELADKVTEYLADAF